MSAVPEFMGLPLQHRKRPRPDLQVVDSRRDGGESGEQTFWQWFAVGVLIFCWIAEATLCAARGF